MRKREEMVSVGFLTMQIALLEMNANLFMKMHHIADLVQIVGIFQRVSFTTKRLLNKEIIF